MQVCKVLNAVEVAAPLDLKLNALMTRVTAHWQTILHTVRLH